MSTETATVVIKPEDYINIQYQDGPIKENGVNGCQIDDVIAFAHATLVKLNSKDDGKYSCLENEAAILALGSAAASLRARTANREARGVEGTSAV